MWILVFSLTITLYEGVATSTIPGFKTKETCEAAAKELSKHYRSILCVEVK